VVTYHKENKSPTNMQIIAAILLSGAYLIWGLWLLGRRWASSNDLDLGFFLSLIPIAIATWLSLYLAGA